MPEPKESDLRARLLQAEMMSAERISEKERAKKEAKRVSGELQQALGESQFYKDENEGLKLLQRSYGERRLTMQYTYPTILKPLINQQGMLPSND